MALPASKHILNTPTLSRRVSIYCSNLSSEGFPRSSVSKESACNAEDLGLTPASGRSPGERNGNPFQYSCLKIPVDRGSWWAPVHEIARSWTQLSVCACAHTHTHTHPATYSCCVERQLWVTAALI